MNHDYIEEQQVVERYVMGRLPPEEAARFEEHYLHCQECLDRLDVAESMERGFKRAAGQDAARAASIRQLALVAWLARLGRSRQLAALAMAVLVIAVLPGLLGLREVRERERELAETRSALEQERERSAQGSRTAGSEAEKLRKELEASRRDLAREQEARTKAAEQLADARRPQGNVPILFLNPERGGGEPTHRLRLPRAPGWVVLALEIDPPHQPSYRAVLQDAKGKELWRGEGLRLNEMETLSLSLPTTLLAPGDYILLVEGRRFTFRVLPSA
ncbi:MAG TPA: zf-HC2 domain-containing protein [Thermoanaerobaculia bacterium]|nr:zf-HC2 domain-containing protein [Thermoanaerobaculia bacterium]